MTQWLRWPYAGGMVRALALILVLALTACASESPFTPLVDSGAEVTADVQPSDTAAEDTAPPDAPLEASTDTGTEDTGRDAGADAPGDVLPDADCDRDRDGHRARACGGDDCDDTRGDVHPGASEWCDGVDGDCDGVADALPDGGVDPGSAAFCRTSLTAGVTYDVQPARCVLPPGRFVGSCPPFGSPQCVGCRRDGTRTVCEHNWNGDGHPSTIATCF